MSTGIKKHFNIKKMENHATKRSASVAGLGDVQDEERSAGDAGTESAGMGLITSSVQKPISMGTITFEVERSYMWSLVNSASSCAFVAMTAPTTGVAIASDFHEIPLNNLSFFLGRRWTSFITSIGSAWRIHSPKVWIDNMNYIAGQEATTAASKIDYSGNYAPTVDVLINELITPSARTRYRDYDAYGRQRATSANNPVTIRSMCDAAEQRPVGLPIVNFEAQATSLAVGTPAPPWYRHVTNHKMDSSIEFSPPVFSGWRRNVQASDQPTTIPFSTYAYNTADSGGNSANLFEKVPYWDAASNQFDISIGYLAADNVNRACSFRKNISGELVDGPKCQPTFIRIRDPPKWGDGATAGSSSTSAVQQVALKANLNMRATCVVEIDMNLAYANDIASNYYNNMNYFQPTSPSYIPVGINTGAPVQPDCGSASYTDFNEKLYDNPLIKKPIVLTDEESDYSE